MHCSKSTKVLTILGLVSLISVLSASVVLAQNDRGGNGRDGIPQRRVGGGTRMQFDQFN